MDSTISTSGLETLSKQQDGMSLTSDLSSLPIKDSKQDQEM